MLFERIEKDKLVITLPFTADAFGLQNLLDYAMYLYATATTKAEQAEVDRLSGEVNAGWWVMNGNRFVN